MGEWTLKPNWFQRLLCRLQIHDWETWQRFPEGERWTRCKRCGMRKYGDLVGHDKW